MSTDYHFQVECSRDCGVLLSERRTLREAFEAMLEDHDSCRPAVVTIVRRGRTPAKKRWRWTVWIHAGRMSKPRRRDAPVHARGQGRRRGRCRGVSLLQIALSNS